MKKPKQKDACERCRFWRKGCRINKTEVFGGQCRRYAPTPSAGKDVLLYTYICWPGAFSNCWCGEFQPRKQV